MPAFLRDVIRNLGSFPLELLRLLLLFLYLLWRLFILIFLILLRRPWWKDRSPQEDCRDKIPPHLQRRPDPCLYSQTYLMQQGIPVTWDNPDIFLTELDGTPVPSSQLQPSHLYIVNARIWDAAFDPALGVEVRCTFRHWGFSAPAEPVQKNPDGSEHVDVINIAPWTNTIAQFRWTTPSIAGHFCLVIKCFHPDDKNPANNVGQENTDVVSASGGEKFVLTAALWNPGRRPTQIGFAADTYTIPEKHWEFPLETWVREIGGPPVLVREGALEVSRSLRQWIRGEGRRGPRNTKYFYVGRDALFHNQRETPRAIPVGWVFRINGRLHNEPLTLGAGEERNLKVEVEVPSGARSGDSYAFNLSATDPQRGPLGGVTVYVKVR